MSVKNFFALLSLFAITSGCNWLDKQPPLDVMTAPPYLQSQSQRMQEQLMEMRAFHEKESAEISEDLHIVRNREIERLGATSKELENGHPPQEENGQVFKKRGIMMTGWFKNG